MRPGIGVEIGALTSLSAIEDSEYLRRNYRVCTEAVKTVASPILRNMGTLGGNICLDTRCVWYNQSLPGARPAVSASRKMAIYAMWLRADTNAGPPSPVTRRRRCSAWREMEIVGAVVSRRMALNDFYTNVGDARMRLTA